MNFTNIASKEIFSFVTSCEFIEDITPNAINEILWNTVGGVDEFGNLGYDKNIASSVYLPEAYIAIARCLIDADGFFDGNNHFLGAISNAFDMGSKAVQSCRDLSYAPFFQEKVHNLLAEYIGYNKSASESINELAYSYGISDNCKIDCTINALDILVDALIDEHKSPAGRDEGIRLIKCLIKSSGVHPSHLVSTRFNDFAYEKFNFTAFKTNKNDTPAFSIDVERINNYGDTQDNGVLLFTNNGVQYVGGEKGIRINYSQIAKVLITQNQVSISKLQGNAVQFKCQLTDSTEVLHMTRLVESFQMETK